MIKTAPRGGELADAAGVNVQTLHYYERRGLLAEPVRSPGGHRMYSAQDPTEHVPSTLAGADHQFAVDVK